MDYIVLILYKKGITIKISTETDDFIDFSIF